MTIAPRLAAADPVARPFAGGAKASPDRPRWSLRTLAVVLTGVLLVPTIGLAALMVFRLAQAQGSLDQARDLGMARALSNQIDSKLAEMRAALLALGTSIDLPAHDFASFYREAGTVAAQNGALIVLADAEGRQLFNTGRPFGAALPELRSAEQAKKAAVTGKAQVTDLFQGSATQKPVVAIYVPIIEQPRTRLVLGMGIRPEVLSRVLAEQQVSKGWTVTIVDRNGRVIGRNQELEKHLGTLVAADLRSAMARGEGLAVLRPQRHNKVYTAFTRSPLSGWTVVFGIPCAEADAPLWASLYEVGLGGGALALLALAIALAAIHPIRRSISNLSRAAAALGKGEALPEPTGSVREIDGVIAAMRDAAGVLHRRAAERDRAAAALRESQERFRDFALTSSDMFWEQDAELRFTSASANPEHTAEEWKFLLGKRRWERTDIDPTQPIWSAHKADLAARRPFRNFRYERSDGRGGVRHLRVCGTPVFDAAGGFRGYRGTVVDETEMVEARRRAERAEALLRDAIDSMSEGFVILDAEDRFVMCNEAYRRLYPEGARAMVPGARFADILGASLEARYVKEAIGREDEWLAERLRWQWEPAGAIERELADGRWILVTERQMRNGGKAGLRIDITALKAVQAKLQESEDRLNHAQRIAHLGSGIRDLHTDKAVWSDEVYRIFGVARDGFEPTTENLLKLVHPEDRAAIIATRSPPDGETQTEPFDFRIIRPDGALRHIRREYEVIRDAAGAPLYLSGAIQDVTELRAAQEREKELEGQLLHSQKLEALGTLAGGIAHDLNNALVPVLAMTELVRDDLPADSHERDCLGLAVDGSRRAKALVQQILAFSRDQPVAEVEFDPNSVMADSLRMLRATLPSTIALRVETDPVPPIRGDPGQLHQMLVNLVTNAEQAIADRPGTISARLRPEAGGAQIRITVADTGCGMDRVTKQRIFEPFFTTKAVGKGTGLGLSIVYRIVTNHGGTITVDSEPGKGTRFEIVLPTSRCRPAQAA